MENFNYAAMPHSADGVKSRSTTFATISARESTHGLLDIHEQALGEFHDGREDKGHGGLLSQKADY